MSTPDGVVGSDRSLRRPRPRLPASPNGANDTFEVRFRRDSNSRGVPRVEVEHVQSDHRAEGRWRTAPNRADGSDGLDRIADQIRGDAAAESEGQE